MRLAAYVAGQSDLSDLELKILPMKLDASTKKLAQELIDRKADVIGLPTYMWTSLKSREIAQSLAEKSPNTLVVVGGPETSTFDYTTWPDNTLFVLGEGEKSLHWILRKRIENPDFMGEDPDQMYQSVYSQVRKRSQAVIQIEKDLAVGIPIYSEEFLRLLEHPEQLDTTFTWHDTAVSCPYNCGYCGHKTRPNVVFRPDDVIEQEIRNIGKLRFENVFVIDPILGGIPGRDNKILQWYQQYAPDTAISAYYRPEYFNDETITLLASSNIKEILIGLQSTNPDVPKWLRSNNLAKVKKYLPQLSQKGIPNRIELITGMPGDSPNGQRESLRFVIEEIQPMSIWSYHLTVIPETKLYNILDADQRGQDIWIHADLAKSRATDASSYTSQEMNQMLVYAGAVTSLYNTLRKRGDQTINGHPITLKQIEQIIKPVIDLENEEIIQYFKSSNMKRAMQYWDEKI